MEGKKQGYSSSSSSFTSDLFGGHTPPQDASAGIFSSIFPPPKAVPSSYSWEKESSENQQWNGRKGLPGMAGDASHRAPSKGRNSSFQGESLEPCHLSSSLYYGGQDMYSQHPNNQAPVSYTSFKKDGREDDPSGNNPNSASRGNWWQGSLYY